LSGDFSRHKLENRVQEGKEERRIQQGSVICVLQRREKVKQGTVESLRKITLENIIRHGGAVFCNTEAIIYM
jgi:hypothetical protein